MGYSIYIGQAELESEFDGDNYDRPHAEWVVHRMEHPEAPFTADNTGRSNNRDPGYGQWDGFVRAVGLHDVFFNDEYGLMRPHPGCNRLTASHLAAFEDSQREYTAKHPDSRPGWCRCRECSIPWAAKPDAPPHDPALDFNMCRLEWLVWWTRYALTNCSRPAIYNR